jgi:hypothetical protein
MIRILSYAIVTLAVLLLAVIAVQAQVIQAENYTAQKGTSKYQADGGTVVGSIETGDWMEYSVNVPFTATYQVSFRVATPYVGARLSFATTAFNLPITGSLNTYTTHMVPMQLTGGQQTIRITSNSYRWNINWFEISPPPVPIAYAGRDTTIQFPQDWYVLQGVATNGTGKWSGTNIREDRAVDMYKGVYQFVYTVTGPGGIARDTVNITAAFDPDKIFTILDGGAFGRYAVTNNGVVYLIMK